MTISTGSGGRSPEGQQTPPSEARILPRITKRLGEVTSREVDLILFAVLLFFVVFYELQNVWGFVSAFKVREVLYLYLMVRVLTAYRVQVNLGVILLFLFFLYASFVALHTWLGYGSEFAIRGFLRWVNTALLAPIALVLFRDMEAARKVLYFWVALVALGAMAGPYQCLGGQLDWLVRGYVSLRGGVIRFKTLLGEPNVGGMAGVMMLGIGLMGIRSAIAASVVVAFALLMMVFSVSKAALAGSIIVAALSLWHSDVSIKKTVQILAIGASLIGVVIVMIPDLGRCLFTRLDVSVRSFFGAAEGNAVDDVYDRVVRMTMEGIDVLQRESKSPVLALLLGGSFAIAGSAAVEVGRRQAILPHNSFSEVFLVGGALYLLIFVGLLAVAYVRLSKYHRSDIGKAARCAFICSVLFAMTYPVIYAPALGALFWLIVGVSLGDAMNGKSGIADRV